MSYVSENLLKDEHVVCVARLHWIRYADALVCFICAMLILVPIFVFEFEAYLDNWFVAFSAVPMISSVILVLSDLWVQWTTEMAVTNRRLIFKTGFIRRSTKEFELSAIETVQVEQSIIGRMLDYGAVTAKGEGQSQETLPGICHPIAVRNAIAAG